MEGKYNFNRKLLVDFILLCLPVILILLQVCYPIRALFKSEVQILIFLCWIILLFFFKRNFFIKVLKKNLVLILFCVYLGIKLIIANRLDYVTYSPLLFAIKFYQLFVFYVIYLYLNDLPLKSKKYILYITLISICISNLISIYYVIFVHPDLIRAGLSNIYFACGDYELANANVFLSGILFYCILKKKYFISKKVLIITFILSILTVLFSNLMTSIILLLVSISFAVYFSKFSSIRYLIYGSFIILIFFIFFKQGLIDILYFLGENQFISEYMGVKMINIANFLKGIGDTGTLGMRLVQISLSITTFKSYPLFGVPFSLFGQATIGYHEEWFSDLATIGIFGFIIIFLILSNIMNNLLKSSRSKETILISCLTFIVMGFLNPNFLGAILVIIFTVSTFILEQNDLAGCKTNNYVDNYANVKSNLLIDNCSDQYPILSIVIPTYNRSDYLMESINSILDQESKISYEILILDNHSDDIDKKKEMLSTIRNLKLYSNEKNIGMFGNINRGFSLASSENVVLLHDDDILKNNYFKVISEYINSDFDVLYGLHDFIGSKKNLEKKYEKYLKKIFSFTRVYRQRSQVISNQNIFYSRRNIYGPPTCGMIVKKNAFYRFSGFDENFFPSSDFKFLLTVGENKKIIRINECISSYRIEINESLNINTKRKFALQEVILFNELQTKYKSLFFLLFKDCYIYNISQMFLDDDIYLNELEKLKIEINKPSSLKNFIYNLIRLSYFYINNLN